jgi:hypothetical protein
MALRGDFRGDLPEMLSNNDLSFKNTQDWMRARGTGLRVPHEFGQI